MAYFIHLHIQHFRGKGTRNEMLSFLIPRLQQLHSHSFSIGSSHITYRYPDIPFIRIDVRRTNECITAHITPFIVQHRPGEMERADERPRDGVRRGGWGLGLERKKTMSGGRDSGRRGRLGDVVEEEKGRPERS